MALYPKRNDKEQMRNFSNVLYNLDEEYIEKERLFYAGAQCTVIPDNRKVSIVQKFYKVFYNKGTLPIYIYMICYHKCVKAELKDIDQDRWTANFIMKSDNSSFQCHIYFPVGEKISGCIDCLKQMTKNILSPVS